MSHPVRRAPVRSECNTEDEIELTATRITFVIALDRSLACDETLCSSPRGRANHAGEPWHSLVSALN